MKRGDTLLYFPSKKDLWLGIVVWGAALLPLAIYIFEPTTSMPLFLGVLLMIFIGWIWFKTGYTFNDKELVAREGPFRWKINLENINRVRRTRNPLSSPALSLDRLEIEYSNGKFILISPADKETFLNTLKERCPRVDIRHL